MENSVERRDAQLNHIEEKRFIFQHIRTFVIVNVVCLLVFLNYNFIFNLIGESNLASLKIIIQMCMLVAISSIGFQIWFSTRFNLDNKNVHIGALFFTIGLFQIVHIVSSDGLPNYLHYDYGKFSDLFDLITHNLMPLGMIVILLMSYREITQRYRKAVFSAAIFLAFVFIVLCFWNLAYIHMLFEQFNLKMILQTTAIISQIVLVVLLLKNFKWSRRRNFLFLIATLYFIIGNVLFTISTAHTDVYYLVGELIQVCAFITLFYAIYYSSVERPYKDLALSEMRMQKMAYYDEISGLPNQRYLEEKLERELLVAKKRKAILLIEVERLDAIKASFGRKSMNELVLILAERFTKVLEEDQLLIQFGKNQFMLYLKEYRQENVQLVCERLRQCLDQPIQIKHYSLRMKFHVGVAIYPTDAYYPEELFQCAHFALNEAKQSVTGNLAFYTAEIEKKNKEQLQLEHDLEKALQNNELFLEYQPQLDLKTRELCSVEALVRWQHPIKGKIPPNHFIPIAEDSGLIIPLGLIVLKKACQEMKQWQQSTGKMISVAVNVSLSQLYQENFLHEVRNVLCETEFDAKYLQLEITESMTIEATQLIPILKELKQMGIAIAIDDFGTGYSSLSYLTDFPLDCLKIDRSFVNKIGVSHKGAAIVTTILAMAKHLQVKVVAEGIETAEQLAYLEQAGCDKIQGYYISRPIPFNELVNSYDEMLAKVYTLV